MFTYESRLCPNTADGRERVWRRAGKRYEATKHLRIVNKIVEGDGCVMVGTDITWHYRTHLVVIFGSKTLH